MIEEALARLTTTTFVLGLFVIGIAIVVFCLLMLIAILHHSEKRIAKYHHDNFIRKNPDIEKAFNAWKKNLNRRN